MLGLYLFKKLEARSNFSEVSYTLHLLTEFSLEAATPVVPLLASTDDYDDGVADAGVSLSIGDRKGKEKNA